MGNLGKLYLTDLIRRECWDDMLVKGRGLVVSYSLRLFSLLDNCKPQSRWLPIVIVSK